MIMIISLILQFIIIIIDSLISGFQLKYLVETSVYPRESPLLRDLRAATDSHPL